MKRFPSLAVLTALAILATPGFAAPAPFAEANPGPAAIEWQSSQGGMRLLLTVSGPEGFYVRQEFRAGEAARFSVFDETGNLRPAGSYSYELRALPVLGESERQALEQARETGSMAPVQALQKTGALPAEPLVQSGSFAIQNGAILMGGEEEPGAAPPAGNRLATKDQVIPDDLIVQGSLCVGFDCVNNENFSFDTIRMKENNTRLTFIDTSTVSGFPAGDWQIRANDSSSGGANFLSIDWLGTGATTGNAPVTTPFRVDGTAPSNSIRVGSTGRVGFRTANPVLDLHIATSNTPGLRLEQTSAGGFSARTWDIAGNEANFFVRDVTGGSRLPFRIRPGAPTSSIDINAAGNVGIGTASPSKPLHVSRSDGTAQVLVTETNGTTAERDLIELTNNGNSIMRMTHTGLSSEWRFGNLGNDFQMTKDGSGVVEMRINSGGNVTIAGTLTENSSRTVKTDFETRSPKEILEQLVALEIPVWSYEHDPEKARHIGPIAEEFWSAFGLGEDDRHIAPSDKAGVALAAIQGLNAVVVEKERELQELRLEVQDLKTLLRQFVGQREASDL